ncbi:MAG TPA: adenylate/guanylate cyclase domain-containing protein [Chitinophagales bacterium]|nr:adenylate/guanylate cyclase domain-containing protein [Chitinophagales bacterium]
MEENIAILIADLSGYTALTETHGAASAADLIDKYTEIVNRCLAAGCHLHSRTGDEVVIISGSVDHLIATAIMLLQNTSVENNFLQVHGGLHYGKILKRNENYFGTTINLASRIASKANPGTFWCSMDYINALENKSGFTFHPRGKHSFKNLSEENEIFELVISDPKSFHIDPVCRMLINEKENAIPHPEEQNIFFCSQHCFDIYTKNKAQLNEQ